MEAVKWHFTQQESLLNCLIYVGLGCGRMASWSLIPAMILPYSGWIDMSRWRTTLPPSVYQVESNVFYLTTLPPSVYQVESNVFYLTTLP
jgi:hypothetical protein